MHHDYLQHNFIYILELSVEYFLWHPKGFADQQFLNQLLNLYFSDALMSQVTYWQTMIQFSFMTSIH